MATSISNVSKRFIHISRAYFNTNEAFITKVKRSVYVRTYPTTIVQPDGSTFNIRYHEPRQIIQLPLKFEELSAEEQQVVLARRRPKEKVKKVEEFKDNFNAKKYLKFVKKPGQ